MTVLLDIKDNKALSLLEVLNSLPYVKTTTISPQKSTIMKGIKEAVEEVNLFKAGKKKARNAEDFLNEL